MKHGRKLLCLALVMLMFAGCESSGDDREIRKDRDDKVEEPTQSTSTEAEDRENEESAQSMPTETEDREDVATEESAATETQAREEEESKPSGFAEVEDQKNQEEKPKPNPSKETEDRVSQNEKPKPKSSVEVEYRLMDGSWYNQNGDVLVSHVYKQVVVLDDSDAAQKINKAIEEDGTAFVTDQGVRMCETEEEMEEFLEMSGVGYDDLCHDADSKVTHNGGGILSIRMETQWYMGGVYNEDYYGMTFDLKTGEKLNVLQLMGGDAAKAKAMLDVIICDYIVKEYGAELIDDPVQVLAGYSAAEYNFYVERGQIIVTFDTYTFACGADGATVVPTGIMIG